MTNNHLHKQYRIDKQVINEHDAITAGVYSIYWLDDNDHIEKIEMVDGTTLFKVIYTDQQPPFTALIAEHRHNHPDMVCEFWSSKQKIAENSFKFDIHLFGIQGKLVSKIACIEDALGNILSETKYSASGAFISRSNYKYDQNKKLSRVQECDSFGKVISEQEMS